MSRDLLEPLLKGAGLLGYQLNELQQQQLVEFYHNLIETNKQVNLTSIVEAQEVAEKHFLDSLTCFSLIPAGTKKLIDVGTGAGFPGLVLKIYQPQLELVLLDSLQKRVDYLNNLIDLLQLENITAIHGRAEDIGRHSMHREKYDVVVSRAVANLSTLSEYCLPLVKVTGSFIAMKGPKAQQEIMAAHKAIQTLGGQLTEVSEFSLPLSKEERTLIKIKKVAATPAKYPRRAGMPAKKPIK